MAADLGTLTARLKLDTTGAEASVGRLSSTLGGALRGAVGLAAAYLGFESIKKVIEDATKAFSDQQVATALLNLALKDTGQTWTPALTKAFDSASAKLLSYGDDAATVEGALQRLVLRGVPAAAAIGDLSQIANFAATAHLTLANATDVLDKAVSGRLSPTLKELGATTLPKGVTGVAALDRILAQIAPHTAGAATTLNSTLTGALATLGATINDKVMVPMGAFIDKGLEAFANWVSAHGTQISAVMSTAMTALGNVFNWLAVNVMPTVIGAFGSLGRWISDNQPLIKGIAGTIGTILTAAFKALQVAVPIAVAIISRVLGTLGTIIGAVITALEAIVHWGGWAPIVSVFGRVFGVVAGGIGGIVRAVVAIITGMSVALDAVVHWSGWGTIVSIFSKPFGLIVTIIQGVVTAIEAIVTGIKDVIQWLGKLGQSKVPFVAGAPNVPGPNSRPQNIVPVKGLGGDVLAGVRYRVGDRGSEEFTPWTNGTITPHNQLSGSSHTINVYVTNPNASAEDIANRVSWALKTAAV